MKAATLRTYLSVHSWVGIASGIFLFIAFYAGAISVFVHELQGWGAPPRPMPTREEGLAAAQRLLDAVARDGKLAGEPFLVLPGEHGVEPSLRFFDEATRTEHRFAPDGRGGAIETAPRSGFVDFVYDLHFTAGLPRAFGTYLFGIVCVLYGLALVSGVVLYAPVFFRDLFALRIGRNLKRLWQDAHNVIGVLSLPFHVMFAWSGAVLTIGFVLLAPFQFLVFENRLLDVLEADFEVAPHVAEAGVAQTMLPVAELVRRAEAALPGLSAESLSFHDPGDANAIATVYGPIAQRRLTNLGAVALRAGDGETIRALPPDDFTPGTTFLRGLQTLHYGNFGAAAVKWLYFVLGLAGAFLFYTGNLLWIESRRKRRQPAQPRSTRFMAALTLGTCLGCVAGVSAVFVAGALLPEAWTPRVYWTVFLACSAWAFLRPPARAAHELLLGCALLTLAVPAAGWIGSGESPLAALARGDAHRPLIDVVAVLLAIAFQRMATAALRRGREGDPNSVWALPG